MKKNLLLVLLTLFCCVFFVKCSTTTPEEYFNISVLNTNMFASFAGNGMLRQMGAPSGNREEMNTKIKFIEENYGKVKDLKKTDDTKDMINATLALYEYVLPVYKTEYVQLADLFDQGAPEEQIESFDKSIQDKYYTQYKELYDKLISIGKTYAAKHNIKVNWGNG